MWQTYELIAHRRTQNCQTTPFWVSVFINTQNFRKQLHTGRSPSNIHRTSIPQQKHQNNKLAQLSTNPHTNFLKASTDRTNAFRCRWCQTPLPEASARNLCQKPLPADQSRRGAAVSLDAWKCGRRTDPSVGERARAAGKKK